MSSKVRDAFHIAEFILLAYATIIEVNVHTKL